MYLVFDTETTNLPQPNYHPNSPLFARVLQIGCLLLDEKFEEVSSFSSLIKLPEHTEISASAYLKHNIDKEKCQKYGLDIDKALIVLQEFFEKAEIHVAHNIAFDFRMLKMEFSFAFHDNDLTLSRPFCTMLSMTPICKLPNIKRPNTGYKWPKLQEAYEYCYKTTFDKAHDALADCKACGKVLKWLSDNKFLVVK